MDAGNSIKKEGLFDGGETTVTITLDDDQTLDCVVLTIFEAGGEGNEYIAVIPEDEEDYEGEVYLYKYKETDDGQPILTNIESDDEYEKVADAFDEILDAQEFDELNQDDEDDEE